VGTILFVQRTVPPRIKLIFSAYKSWKILLENVFEIFAIDFYIAILKIFANIVSSERILGNNDSME
jgi:hypothetical protein